MITYEEFKHSATAPVLNEQERAKLIPIEHREIIGNLYDCHTVEVGTAISGTAKAFSEFR